MASLGRAASVAFFLHPSNDKSFALGRGYGMQPAAGFPMPARSRLSCLGLQRHNGNLRFLRVGNGDRDVGNSCVGRTTGGRLLALGKEDVAAPGAGDEGNDDIGDVDLSGDEVLKATIGKSKKALAMQKRLLEQIVERRKLVASIKESVINMQNDSPSYDKSETSSSTLFSGTTNRNAGNEYKSLSYNPLEAAEVSSVSHNGNLVTIKEKQQSDQVKGSIRKISAVTSKAERSVDEGANKDGSSSEDSIAESLGLMRESTSKVDQSKTVSSLPKVSEAYNAKDKKLGEIEEKNEKGDAHDETGVSCDKINVKPPPLAGINVMNVILVAAECAPWSKTGGLADVAGSLPKALARRGHRVMVVVPLYGNYSEPQGTGVRKSFKVDGQDMEVTYYHAYIDGVDFVFIESPIYRHRQSDIYGGQRVDILKRMVLLCKAAVEVPWHVPCGGICYGDGNLVFIANDWHTALLPVYLKAHYRDNGLMKYTRCVLVIHNIAHQGRGPMEDFGCVGLPEHYTEIFRLYDPVGGEHFNIFAAGIKCAERVVTVSRGYAWEIKTVEGGWGLDGIINENDRKLQGIVNGVDTEDWNPEVDIHLKTDGYSNYSLETLESGKPQCKAALQKELGLPVRPEVPIVAFIGRLDHQKGVDLIADAIPWMASQDMQLIMLGTGRLDLENMLRSFEGQHRDKIRSWVGFSVKMAHRITAGADVLLMPSRFEPCGLNQLYAMMYGTIPVVHAVGGLRDTVQPFDPYQERGHGWTFDRAEAGRLIDALGNCFRTYRNYKKSWEGLQRRGMSQDLSWDHAAQLYEEVLVAAKYQW